MTTNIKEDDFTIDGNVHKVLVNAEGQHSIWPAGQPAPIGWEEVGFSGTKVQCSEYVDKSWLDMRPNSLAKEMSSSIN